MDFPAADRAEETNIRVMMVSREPATAAYYRNVNLPSVLGFMHGACKWVAGVSRAFPTGSLVLWTAIALAFPFAAQLLLERAEV